MVINTLVPVFNLSVLRCFYQDCNLHTNMQFRHLMINGVEKNHCKDLNINSFDCSFEGDRWPMDKCFLCAVRRGLLPRQRKNIVVPGLRGLEQHFVYKWEEGERASRAFHRRMRMRKYTSFQQTYRPGFVKLFCLDLFIVQTATIF